MSTASIEDAIAEAGQVECDEILLGRMKARRKRYVAIACEKFGAEAIIMNEQLESAAAYLKAGRLDDRIPFGSISPHFAPL